MGIWYRYRIVRSYHDLNLVGQKKIPTLAVSVALLECYTSCYIWHSEQVQDFFSC